MFGVCTCGPLGHLILFKVFLTGSCRTASAKSLGGLEDDGQTPNAASFLMSTATEKLSSALKEESFLYAKMFVRCKILNAELSAACLQEHVHWFCVGQID